MKIRLDKLARVIGGELAQGNPQAQVSGVSTDSRAVKRGQVFFALKGEKFDGHKFVKIAAKQGAVAAVVQRDFKVALAKGFGLIKVADPLFALGELSRFERAQRDLKVVGITGSVGKTTTKEMVALVLSRKYRTVKSPGNFNNLIGLPLAIFGIADRAEVAVLELASNQPGEIARLSELAQAHIGVIVRIAPVHLQGFGDLEGVEREKRALLSSLGPQGTFIFNMSDPRLCRLALGYAGRKIGFGLRAPASDCAEIQVRAEKVALIKKGGALTQKFTARISGGIKGAVEIEFKALGEHLVENALAAISVGLALGMRLKPIAAALGKFEPVKGRGKLEQGRNCAWLLDESYNANPESMRQALRVFEAYGKTVKGRKILVLGEMAELGGHSKTAHRELGKILRKISFNKLYYVGSYARELRRGLGYGAEAKVEIKTNLNNLKRQLAKELKPGDLVLVKGSHVTGLEQIANWLREQEHAL